MGYKLSVEEIDQHIIDHPNTGFDTCKYCNHVEEQGDMSSLNDVSDELVCDDCNDMFSRKIKVDLDEAIDGLFVTAHQLFVTKSGDISPVEIRRLDALKRQVVDLILTQTKRNT